MNIPIENIYFLLCYAWDRLKEKDIVSVTGEDVNDLLNLFAKVLVNSTTYLFKRGLDRYYIEREEVLTGIKGKFDITTTVKQNLLDSKRTACIFDEFSYNILHNQILKTILCRLLRTKDIDPDIYIQIKKILIKFPAVDEIVIRPSTFKKVRIHKNNYFYDFVLKVCEIIYNTTFIEEKSGLYKFQDFIRDEVKMAYLFEAFIRNFYKRELDGYQVTREDISWDFQALQEDANKYLPIMQTDITIKSADRRIIIDTKYKKETLQHCHDTEKIHSSNLYQLFAYLKNVESKDKLGRQCEGILLYPTINKEVSLNYKYENHLVKIRTINLNQHWKKIHQDLVGMVEG